jgi:hypothetical protein
MLVVQQGMDKYMICRCEVTAARIWVGSEIVGDTVSMIVMQGLIDNSSFDLKEDTDLLDIVPLLIVEAWDKSFDVV